MTTEKEETKKVSSNQQFIRVHFYLGPVCRSEIFHPDRDFYDNKIEILSRIQTKLVLLHFLQIQLDFEL